MTYKPIEQRFSVEYQYRLHFTRDLFSPENDQLAEIIRSYKPEGTTKLLFVLDDGVAAAFPGLHDKIQAWCRLNEATDFREIITVAGGEEVKNDDRYVEEVLKAIDRNHICRHSFVIVIGGGAVIDMAGYAATIAHRGVKLIRVPTTVLSQNDAAVGVKNGINYFGKKNFIGTFAVPYAIINDADFLTTLEQRDWIAGVSEGVKVSLIKDHDFFEFIERHAADFPARKPDIMQELIYRCAELHMQHIARGGDPFESGSSRPLDFGHWAAHKLEHMTGYSIRHGEAVAVGMALDVTYAMLCNITTEEVRNRVIRVLETIGFDLRLPVNGDEEIETLLNGIEEFREHLGGKLTITLLTEIGNKHDVHEIDTALMREAIRIMSNQQIDA